jgi:hypothetical protein
MKLIRVLDGNFSLVGNGLCHADLCFNRVTALTDQRDAPATDAIVHDWRSLDNHLAILPDKSSSARVARFILQAAATTGSALELLRSTCTHLLPLKAQDIGDDVISL